MFSLDNLRLYWQHPNVLAFSQVVRHCEGTPDGDGYRRMFGGALFESFADHPRIVQTFKLRKGGTLSSTAAGAYQILARTWDGLVKQYKFGDFSPENQNLAFVALVVGRKAINDLLNGDLPTVVRKCSLEWASLPGSPYGQPVKTYDEVQKVYLANGGTFDSNDAPKFKTIEPLPEAPAQEPPMLPALVPIVQAGLLEAVPRLIKWFSEDTKTPEAVVKAVETVAEIAKSAVGAKNEQELLDVLKSSPEAVKAVEAAVQANWFTLEEIGGGIQAARAHDIAIMTSDGPWWSAFKSPSFIIALFGLLPLVYLIVLSLIGVIGNAEWSPEVRASLAGAITGAIIGGLVGYYYGQITSRNRTP